MARAHRNPSPDLKASLAGEGATYSFVQVMRLLRILLRQGGPALDRPGRVRVRPQLDLTFAQADLAGVEALEDGTWRVTAHFLGLYGAGSPLPTFYTEELMDEEADGFTASRAFLDLVNAPVYPLHFRSWSKHRLFYHLVEDPDPAALERLHCLMGLGGEALRARVDGADGLLRHAGILNRRPRSAEGLRMLLADALDLPALDLLPCVPREVPVPEGQRLRLGLQGHALGEETVLGERVADRMGLFRLRTGPLGADAFQGLLPGAPGHARARTLVGLYVDRPLAWDLELTLARGEAPGLSLGGTAWCGLGVDAWIEAPEGATDDRSVLHVGAA